MRSASRPGCRSPPGWRPGPGRNTCCQAQLTATRAVSGIVGIRPSSGPGRAGSVSRSLRAGSTAGVSGATSTPLRRKSPRIITWVLRSSTRATAWAWVPVRLLLLVGHGFDQLGSLASLLLYCSMTAPLVLLLPGLDLEGVANQARISWSQSRPWSSPFANFPKEPRIHRYVLFQLADLGAEAFPAGHVLPHRAGQGG